MASELYVETLKGLTSGANANKIVVPAGQTLDASAGTLTPSSGQVVQMLHTAQATTSNNQNSAWADIGMSLDITLTNANNFVVITFMVPYLVDKTSSGASGGGYRILRDSTALGNVQEDGNGPYQLYHYNTSSDRYDIFNYTLRDQPVTASQITYKIQSSSYDTTTNLSSFTGGQAGTMTIMEIAG